MNKLGRPSKEAGDGKQPYNKLLADPKEVENLFKDARLQEATTHLTEAEKKQAERLKFEQIDKILANPEAAEYYYKLIFSFSFHVYQTQLELKEFLLYKSDPVKHPKPRRKKVTMLDMAQKANMEYHHLKNIFSGKGYTVNALRFILFLKENNISFEVIATYEIIVQKAYLYLMVLTNDPASKPK